MVLVLLIDCLDLLRCSGTKSGNRSADAVRLVEVVHLLLQLLRAEAQLGANVVVLVILLRALREIGAKCIAACNNASNDGGLRLLEL